MAYIVWDIMAAAEASTSSSSSATSASSDDNQDNDVLMANNTISVCITKGIKHICKRVVQMAFVLASLRT